VWRIKKEWVGKIVIKKTLWGAKASPLKSLSGGRPGGQKKVRGNKDRMKKGSDTIT